MDIGDMRRDFESEGMDRDALSDDPVRQFGTWFGDAREAGILEPNAMSLATTGANNMPDLRTVLLVSCSIPITKAVKPRRLRKTQGPHCCSPGLA